MIVTQINIDLAGLSRFEYVIAKQADADSRLIQVQLLDNGKIYVLDNLTTARVSITKPDKTEVINDCEISNNMVEILLDANMLAVAGTATAEIILTGSSGDVLTSASFDIKIIATATGKKAESSSEYKSFKEALATVDKLKNEAENIATKEEVDELGKRIDNLIKLEEGSTTGDAELQDIRTGADGTIYETAGTAVRTQFKNIDDKVSAIPTLEFKKYNMPATDEETVYILNSDKSVINTGSMNTSGTVGLSTNARYKYAKIPYADGMSIYVRAYPSAISSYPPAVVYDNGEYSTPEYSTASVEGTAVNYKSIVTGYSDNAVVYVNMYDSQGTFEKTEDYFYIVPASAGGEVNRPAFDNEFIPTINDDVEEEHKTFSSKKIGSMIKSKEKRPTNGTEHFQVTINKHIQNDNSNTGNIQDGITEYIDNGVIFIPESYSKAGTPTRLIISCHGSGTVINSDFSLTSKTWNNFLVNMGYAVMDVNGGADDSRHFGAPWAIQSYIKAYQYVIEKYNLYEEVFVLGGSMGGLPAFTISQCGAIQVKAIAGFCPVVDLFRQAWLKPWYGGESGEAWGTQRKLIAEYFNFTDYDTFSSWTNNKTPSAEEMQYFIDNADKWQGYNPMLCGAVNGETVLTTDTSGYEDLYNDLIKTHKVPVKIWQSDADPTVAPEFGKYIVSAIKRAGGIAYHRSYPEGGHTPGWGSTITIQNEQGQDISGYSNEVECYYWFKRWE